jgi:hypothetical protein
MGEIVRRTAASGDIVSDTRAALTNARAKGGRWKELAEAQLADLVAIIDQVETQMNDADRELAPLVAALKAKNDEADHLLGRVSDEIWNEVGRPGSDPALSVLFPGGIAYYADGDVEGQPDRMDLLARLLETNIHPRLTPATAKAKASEIRAEANALRVIVDAARAPSTQAGLLRRVHRAIATTAQGALINLKRFYKTERFSEADIHAVIPDRPGPARKPAPPAPASAPPSSSPPATN